MKDDTFMNFGVVALVVIASFYAGMRYGQSQQPDTPRTSASSGFMQPMQVPATAPSGTVQPGQPANNTQPLDNSEFHQNLIELLISKGEVGQAKSLIETYKNMPGIKDRYKNELEVLEYRLNHP